MSMLLCIIISMNELQTIDKDIQLTEQEILFSSLVAKGYSGVTAYRQAFPKAKDLKYDTVRRYASDLLTKTPIITEVATKQERAARMARLAEERIEDILINDSSTVKGNKVADVAMFMYEQANGKATQRIMTENKHVVVTYDLSGGKGGEVPQEILDQLQDE